MLSNIIFPAPSQPSIMVKTRSASIDETRKGNAAEAVVAARARSSQQMAKHRNSRSATPGSRARRSKRTTARLNNIAEDQEDEDDEDEEEAADEADSEEQEDKDEQEEEEEDEEEDDEESEDEAEEEEEDEVEEEDEEEDVGKEEQAPGKQEPKLHSDKLDLESGHGVSHFDIGGTGGRRGRHRRKHRNSRRPQSLQVGCEARTGGGYYSWLDVVSTGTKPGDNNHDSSKPGRKRKRADGVDAGATLAARSAAAAARGNVEEASSGIASALSSEVNALYRSTAADAQREVAADTARKAPETAGRKWFEMEAPEMTDAVRQDLLLLRNRNFIDAKRFYKGAKNEHKKALPKFFQMGTIVEAPHEFVSGRLSKKERKATIMDELLSDDRLRGYTRKTFLQIQKKKSSGGKRWHKNNMNRRKPTWARK